MCRDTLLDFFKHRKTQLSILSTSVDSIRREESEQLAKLHKLKARAVRFTGSRPCAAKQQVIWFACGHWQDVDAEDDPPRCVVCGTMGQKNMDKKKPTTRPPPTLSSSSSLSPLMVCQMMILFFFPLNKKKSPYLFCLCAGCIRQFAVFRKTCVTTIPVELSTS